MLLSVNKIHTYYGKTHILYGVSVGIEKGETVALLGRNGFGKSTTLKSIMGIAPPQSGSIRFKGEEIAGLKPFQICRRGIGLVPQERRIFPNLTARQNLLLGMKPGQKAEGYTWTIEQIYKQFEVLAKKENQKGGHLSGGEQQMLTMGRTLMGNPELILMDEPTEGLAPIVVKAVIGMVRDMQARGCAIILVEHAMDVALELSGRVYVMSKGEIVFGGTTGELYANENVRQKYLEL